MQQNGNSGNNGVNGNGNGTNGYQWPTKIIRNMPDILEDIENECKYSAESPKIFHNLPYSHLLTGSNSSGIHNAMVGSSGNPSHL
jgi:hypothetical protein